MFWRRSPHKRIENLKSIMADMNRDILNIFHRLDLLELKLRHRAYRNVPKEKDEESKDFYNSVLLKE